MITYNLNSSHMNTQDIPGRVAVRILDFFNRVKQVDDITDTLIQDDPTDGSGRTIGQTLAARILRARSEQDFRRFDSLEQLDAIQGFGEGTWKDLTYTFGRTAAEAFRDNLYVNNVIYESNWPIWIFEYPIESQEEFQRIIDDPATYREFIGEKLTEITQETETIETLAASAIGDITQAYIEPFEDVTMAALTFAIWFYRLDPGNWFNFDTMYEHTTAYFEYYYPRYSFQERRYDWYMELVAFKGIPGTIINPAGTAAPDLMTVINHPEQSITIWMSTLYD